MIESKPRTHGFPIQRNAIDPIHSNPLHAPHAALCSCGSSEHHFHPSRTEHRFDLFLVPARKANTPSGCARWLEERITRSRGKTIAPSPASLPPSPEFEGEKGEKSQFSSWRPFPEAGTGDAAATRETIPPFCCSSWPTGSTKGVGNAGKMNPPDPVQRAPGRAPNGKR